MLHQIAHVALEVAAQRIDDVRTDYGAMLVDELRQGHATESRCVRDLLQRNPPPLLELEVGNAFTQLKS